jgi:hypothetical protein
MNHAILPRWFRERERSRVFTPDQTFARRVVLQMRPVTRSAGLVWDYVPSFARPMVAATTLLLLALISYQMMSPTPFPDDSSIGIVEAYLGADGTTVDEWLYRGAEIPDGQDLLIEISVAEAFE